MAEGQVISWYSDEAIRGAHAEAVVTAEKWAHVQGAHHKAWVIDQMMRALLGPMYLTFVRSYEASGEQEWDRGIAP